MHIRKKREKLVYDSRAGQIYNPCRKPYYNHGSPYISGLKLELEIDEGCHLFGHKLHYKLHYYYEDKQFHYPGSLHKNQL